MTTYVKPLGAAFREASQAVPNGSADGGLEFRGR